MSNHNWGETRRALLRLLLPRHKCAKCHEPITKKGLHLTITDGGRSHCYHDGCRPYV